MSDIDWSNAPNGATHYRPYNRRWYKQSKHACEWNGFVWCSMGCNDLGEYPWSQELIERPAEPAWTVAGLPPVGTVCEFMCTARGKEREWQPALVKYASPFTVVLDDYSATAGELEGEFVAHPDTMRFRPIRTPEQIAAEEREKAERELRKDFESWWKEENNGSTLYCESVWRGWKAQYYRKTEAP